VSSRGTSAGQVDTALSTSPGADSGVEVPAQRQHWAQVAPERDAEDSAGADRGGADPVDRPKRDERGDRSAAGVERADKARLPGDASSRQVSPLSREERFTQLFRAHARRVARVIAGAVRPQDHVNVVDDLAQETFLKTWVYLDTVDRGHDEAAGRYIAAIARNTVRSYYRDVARRRSRETPAGHDAPVWASSAAAAPDDVAGAVEEFDAHLAVIKALNDGLPDEVAQVLRLRFYDEAPITEVAERIGRSRATTVRRQAEGLALLREQLATDQADTGDEADVVRGPDALARARRTVDRVEQQRAAATKRAGDRARLAAASPDTSLGDYGATRLVPALRGVADGTAEQYRAGWRQRVLPALGDRPVREIDATAVQRAVRSWTAEDVSRSTVRGARAALVRVLDEAVADGLLARNPARGAENSAASGIDPRERTDRAGASNLAPDRRSVTTGDRSARDDDRRPDQVDLPAPVPATESGRVVARHEDTARAGDEDFHPVDGRTTSAAKGLAAATRPAAEVLPGRPPGAPGADEAGDRDPVAGARWALARVGQLRAAAERERRAEERARAEQLARWHADDQAAEDGHGRDLDGRDLEAGAAARGGGTGLGGRW